MRFEFGGVKYKIWFRYEGDGKRRETLCFIEEEDAPGTTFALGSAVCAPSDTFCKETGRKVALTKALRSGKIQNVCGGGRGKQKQFRTAAWQCYHKRAEQTKEVAVGK